MDSITEPTEIRRKLCSNKNIKTNINGGDRFQWNVTLFYSFNRKYGRNIGEDINRIEDQITDF